MTALSRPALRKHPRVPSGLLARVELGQRSVEVSVADASMEGLSLVGLCADPGDRLTVTVELPGRTLRASTVVRRADGLEVGVELIDLDWDDFLALARYVHPRLH